MIFTQTINVRPFLKRRAKRKHYWYQFFHEEIGICYLGSQHLKEPSFRFVRIRVSPRCKKGRKVVHTGFSGSGFKVGNGVQPIKKIKNIGIHSDYGSFNFFKNIRYFKMKRVYKRCTLSDCFVIRQNKKHPNTFAQFINF